MQSNLLFFSIIIIAILVIGILDRMFLDAGTLSKISQEQKVYFFICPGLLTIVFLGSLALIDNSFWFKTDFWLLIINICFEIIIAVRGYLIIKRNTKILRQIEIIRKFGAFKLKEYKRKQSKNKAKK